MKLSLNVLFLMLLAFGCNKDESEKISQPSQSPTGAKEESLAKVPPPAFSNDPVGGQ